VESSLDLLKTLRQSLSSDSWQHWRSTSIVETSHI